MPIKSKNLHYAYYHEYYDGTVVLYDESDKAGAKRVEERNENLLTNNNKALLVIKVKAASLPEEIDYTSFKLKTTYPGFMTGVGMLHSQKMRGELALGFLFDYVTGSPYIPGASIKGVLRSAFGIPEFICDLLKKCKEDEYSLEFCKEDVPLLEKSIFGVPAEDNDEGSSPMQDIFFDAYPVIGEDSANILETDFITPHEDIIKNPTPIQFLKIKSGVEFKFCFKLHDSVIGEGYNAKTITIKEKEKLFKNIILCLGLGAKTNVGYGAFIAENEEN